MTDVHPQLNRLSDTGKEEVANALAQLQDLGFNSVADIEELMNAATEKLSGGCDGEAVSRILLQLVNVTAMLQELTDSQQNTEKSAETLSPEDLMRKLEQNTETLQSLCK